MQRMAMCMLAGSLWACSPALDWREVRPPDGSVVLLFPCKVHTETRTVGLATRSVAMTLSACDAGDATFAFAHADVGDPAVVGPALDALVSAAARNVGSSQAGAETQVQQPVHVPGMTPHPLARRVRLEGHRPGGRAVGEVIWVFSFGTRVYQATLVGPQIDELAAETFFGSLRVVR